MKIAYIRLLSKMVEHGITQKELAEKMYMTNSALNRRMTGKVEWSVSECKKLCEIFQCCFEELFFDEWDYDNCAGITKNCKCSLRG